MHTLTKIFIVLQALLAIFVMALILPLSVNNDTWKAKFQEENAKTTAAEAEASHANAVKLASEAQHVLAVNGLNGQLQAYDGEVRSKVREIEDLRSRLADAQLAAAEVRAQIDTLIATTKTQSIIVEKQGNEVTDRREQSLSDQRRSIELQDELRDALTKLDVALDAQRILQEQLALLREKTDMGAVAAVLSSTSDDFSNNDMTIPSPPVMGRVLRIEDSGSDTRFAVIDLGSRDGLKENMKFLISRDGRFQGNIIITNVDINRAVGRVELEQDGIMISDVVHGGIRG